MNEVTEHREEIFKSCEIDLSRLARSALNKGVGVSDFVIVCIDVDDLSWKGVVDHLIPNHDWQQIRDRGEIPIAQGTVSSDFCDFIAEIVPDIEEALSEPIPEGQVYAFVMGAGGVSLYLIQPAPEDSSILKV